VNESGTKNKEGTSNIGTRHEGRPTITARNRDSRYIYFEAA
jgi:hypothetical protein